MTTEIIVRIERKIQFKRIPCVGEFFKFSKSGLQPLQITEVTHDENGDAEVVIGPQLDHDGSFWFYETDDEMREDIEDLVSDGWQVMSEKDNTAYSKKPNKAME